MTEPAAPDVLAITSAFDLGTPRAQTFVASTLASHIWKLETDQGRWAIKEHSWRFEHERDRAVFDSENAAVHAGVPLPPPVPAADGRANSDVPNAEGATVTVRVWPWVDLVKIEKPTDNTTLEALGAALARLHSLDVDVEPAPLHPYYWQPPEDEVWSTLTTKARAAKARWAAAFEEHVPQARRLAELAREHPPTDSSNFSAWCHFDLTRNNCQRDARGALVIIDWDDSRPGDPSRDLGWAVAAWCEPHTARSLVNSYERHGGPGRLDNIAAFSIAACVESRWFKSAASQALDGETAVDRNNGTEWLREILEHGLTADRLTSFLRGDYAAPS